MIGEISQVNASHEGNSEKIKSTMKSSPTLLKDFQSPPLKRMKQGCLPFMKLSGQAGPVLQSPVQDNPATKKRKLSDPSTTTPVKSKKINKENVMPIKCKEVEPVTKSCDVAKDREEEVTSSCGDDVEILSVEVGSPKVVRKKESLDWFVRKSQEPHSTSAGGDLDLREKDREADCLVSVEAVPMETDGGVAIVETSNGALADDEDDDGEPVRVETSVEVFDLTGDISSADESASELDTTASSKSSASLSETAATNASPKVTKSDKETSKVDKAKLKVKRKTKTDQEKISEKEKKQKLREEKARIREEKRRKLEAEKVEKDRLKKEAQAKKEQEQEELRKQRELKRKERMALKEKEDRDREEKRQMKQELRQKKLQEIEAKEEEKRKKQEEKQKIEEEKQRKEDEQKKKSEKQKQFFMGFFQKRAVTPVPTDDKKEVCGPFAPFEPKEDMVLAPCVRTNKFEDQTIREIFDNLIGSQDSDELYLKEVKKNSYQPGNSERTVPKEKRSVDVEILSEDVDSDMVTVKAKLLQFHDNHRPAYFGTWRKRSKVVTGRCPLSKDEDLDYEVNSDDEWEQEPGESLSLSDSGGSEDEGDSDGGDDSEDDGFFVPHGYLSDDEADGAGEDKESFEARRAAKAKDWEREIKRKVEKLRIIQIGCYWSGFKDKSSNSKEIEILSPFKMVPLVALPVRLTNDLPQEVKSTDQRTDKDNSTSPQGTQLVAVNNKIRPVPEEAMPDLIRLVHGNIIGIQNLMNEFRAYWKKKNMEGVKNSTSDSSKSVLPSSTSDGMPSQTFSPLLQAEDHFIISKRQLEKKIAKIAVREKRPEYKTCWYVHDSVRAKYKLMDLSVPNKWVYVNKKVAEVAASPGMKRNSLAVMKKSTPGQSPVVKFKTSPPSSGVVVPNLPKESAAATLQSLAVKSSQIMSSPLANSLNIKKKTTPVSQIAPGTNVAVPNSSLAVQVTKRTPKTTTVGSTSLQSVEKETIPLVPSVGTTPVTPKAPPSKSQTMSVRSLEACFAARNKSQAVKSEVFLDKETIPIDAEVILIE